VTESFLPSRNDVTTGVCRILEHLARRGHDTVVICPGPAPESFAGARVIGVPSLSYRRFPVGLPSSRVIRTLSSFAPDVVHLASPFVLGAAGLTAAGQLGIPTVAVFQTDGPGHTRLFRAAARRWVHGIHEQADLNLAQSPASFDRLRANAVPRLRAWVPAVDGTRFDPQRRNTPAVVALRTRLAPDGEVLVGWAGHLVTEEAGPRLSAVAGLPGVRLVMIGDERTDDERADAYAALDVFVHIGTEPTTGSDDTTVSRTICEVLASGVPVVAPTHADDRLDPHGLLAPGLNGLSYRGQDDAGLGAAVTALVQDADQRRWMGSAARIGIERRTWERHGDELIGHYRSVLSHRTSAG